VSVNDDDSHRDATATTTATHKCPPPIASCSVGATTADRQTPAMTTANDFFLFVIAHLQGASVFVKFNE
jgi:hypothetical protein